MNADRFLSPVELDLESKPNSSFARTLLENWSAPNAVQEATRQRMLTFLAKHPEDGHDRTCTAGHLTASGLLFDWNLERVLMTHHRKLKRWLQLGGHCDGDANLVACALREAQEESGIEEISIDPVPVDLDIHTIPARPGLNGDPEHIHLDTRFFLRAAKGAVETLSYESLELRWFSAEELEEIDTDDSVRRLFELAIST